MKRFSFRLQRVLRVREIQQSQARGEWAQARAEQSAHEARLDDLRAAATAESTGIVVGSQHGQDATTALALRASLRARAVQIGTADVAAAAQVTAERAAELQAAARRVQTLERLSERQRLLWEVESKRWQTRVLDDIAGQRAVRASRASDRQDPS